MASSKVKSAQEGPRLDSYRYAVTPEDVGSKKQKKVNIHELKQDLSMEEHKIDIPSLFSRLNTDPKSGLMPEQAMDLLMRHGPNELTLPPATPIWLKFLRQLFGGFSLLMWIGSLLCFIAYAMQVSQQSDPPGDNLYLGIVLMAVVFVTGTFSFYVEQSGGAVMDTFRDQIPQYATVRRGDKKMIIKASEVVVGDIVEVKNGDRIPADIRLLKSRNFQVDNFSLTGVAEPCTRTPEFTHENPLETKNLAFFSTNAVEGSCRGVVINTGDRTVMGRIANLATDVEVGNTSLATEIAHIIHIFTGIAAFAGIFFFIMAFVLSYFWLDAIILLIGVILAHIPIGLLPTITLCLVMTAQRMARKNCMVKSYNVVDTLGATSCIIADKTGVITANRMTAREMWLNGRMIDIDTSTDQSRSAYRSDPTWLALARCAMLCSKAKFLPGQEALSPMSRECEGDATESALLRLTELSMGRVTQFRKRNEEIVSVPFKPAQKYQVSIHQTEDPNDQRALLVMMGAPEIILDKCSTFLKDGKEFTINDQFRAALNLAYLEMGGRGERVLGFCDYILPIEQYPPNYQYTIDKPNFPLNGLRFIGLISLADPPRPAVQEAIRRCRSAQIKVIMTTGDHPITAKAIAKQVGIISEGAKTVEDIAMERGIAPEDVDPRDARACVIHGSDLAEMTNFQIDEILNNHPEIIFARTSPTQKDIIVEGCQRQGQVVAVTGSGVHDSAALRKADIGIGMGISGSDIGRNMADIVLLDDNFASIISGIEEGRLVYDNLKKSIQYTMTSNMPEIWGFFWFLLLDIPLPIGAITILCIELGTDIIPAISLAYEEPEGDVMTQEPRNQLKKKLVNVKLMSNAYAQVGVIQGFAAMFTYFVVMGENGFWLPRTIALRRQWDSRAVNDVQDSYGQEWTFAQRKRLEYMCHTSFFAAIVIVQLANLIVCRTLRFSILQQGFRNHHASFAMMFSITLCVFLTYCPGLDKGLRMFPLRPTWWIAPVPFTFLILILEEIRKVIFRAIARSKILEHHQYL